MVEVSCGCLNARVLRFGIFGTASGEVGGSSVGEESVKDSNSIVIGGDAVIEFSDCRDGVSGCCICNASV